MRLLVLALALTACSSNAPTAAPTTAPATTVPATSAAATAPAATTAPPAATRSATPAATATPKTDLADGRHEAYLSALDVGKRRLTFDVVQFLTGAAAAKAAKEDGQSETPNDYYIRNQNTKLRTLDLAPGLTIVVNVLTAEETGDATKDTPVTLTRLKSFFGGDAMKYALFHVTVKNGVVTRLDEQFLP
jgi:hypothetical protein